MKKDKRTIKWLIFGLEIPILSILGIFIGKELARDNYVIERFIGMFTGATIGLIIGSLILYMFMQRTYTKDKQVIMRFLGN